MKIWVPALLMTAALSAILAPAPAKAEDAAVLMIKHAVFAGWQLGDGKVKSLTFKRSVADKGGKLAYAGAEAHSGMLYRKDDISSDGTAGSNGFTGNLFWESHENGFTTPVIGDASGYYLALDAFLAEGTPQLPAVNNGTDTIDGKPVDIVNVTMQGAKAMNIYVDSATGAYLKVVIDPGGDYETTIDKIRYATVGNKKFVSSLRYDDGSTVTYSDFKVNAPVGNDLLHPPAPSATWAFTNDKPFKVKVTQQNVSFDATVNGVKGRFLFDTGADGILVTQAFARAVNAKTFSHTQTYGIGGEGATKTDLMKVDTIQIGGNTLSNVVISSNKAQFRDEDGTPLDGLIGFGLLGGAVVELSTSDQTMTIHDPMTSLDPFAGVVVSPDLSSGTPVIPMKMNGTVDVSATLDMGDEFQVLFPHDLPAKTGMKFFVDNSSAASHIEFSGVNGTEVDECGDLDSLAVGPIVYGPFPGCTSFSMTGRDIIVGYDLLKNFDFVFAYPQGKMIMNPHRQ